MVLGLVIPVYNDWDSLSELIKRIYQFANNQEIEKITLSLVNDGSTIPQPAEPVIFEKVKIEIIHLKRNLGHQKAIAIGLAYIAENKNYEKVIVMDSDGEDRPEDMKELLAASVQNPEHIIFAKRAKRQEGFTFQLFYQIYKIVFRVLTGKAIAFGNFCLIPQESLKKIVYLSEIWNHFSGGILFSKLKYTSIPLPRGKRIAGKSKMNFANLILHGLSAIAVHLDIMAVRLIIFSLFLIFTSLLGILSVVGVRLFTELAIPGWATSVVLGLVVIIIQSFLLSLFLIFIVLSNRTQKLFIPAIDYKDFIHKIEKI